MDRKEAEAWFEANKDRMVHGKAVLKEDLDEHLKRGAKGIITAYLPNDKVFAIWFENIDLEPPWITFHDSEEWFKEHFEIEMYE